MATDPMAEIRASFFVECEELLESLQDALSEMDEGQHDDETINVVFRAVHSIKGGAGAFGLEALVGFAHRYETVLDELRAGRLAITPEAMKLFFHAADLLQDQVRAARDGGAPPADAETCLQELEALIGGVAPAPEAEEVSDFQPMGLALDFGDLTIEPPAPNQWRVRFTPHDALYASGNEPLHLLRALGELGDCALRCDFERLGTLDGFDPEKALLSWEATITGELTEGEIREVFDFVEDVCDIDILSNEPSQEDGFADMALPPSTRVSPPQKRSRTLCTRRNHRPKPSLQNRPIAVPKSPPHVRWRRSRAPPCALISTGSTGWSISSESLS